MLPFGLTASYDRMRLTTYRDCGRRAAAISISALKNSSLLRFDDVGYFNSVYGYDEDLLGRLDEVEAFFMGSPHGCRLMTPTLTPNSQLALEALDRGWTRSDEYAWLSADSVPHLPLSHTDVAVRAPLSDEHRLFVEMYLQAFDAEPDRIPAAIDNMRHLFSNPQLHFLFACKEDHLAGVAMLQVSGDSALLCAGGMLPAYRGNGGHHTLLAARFELARSLGCTDIHSWALLGGRSHANMERAGLRTVGTTMAMRLPPERLRRRS